MEINFLGTSDDVTTCECCGRKNLKSTVAISVDGSDAIYYGVTCAAHALKRDERYIRTESKRADNAAHAAEQAKLRAKQTAEFNAWDLWLKANSQGEDTFTRIQNLGGYANARARYNTRSLATA